MKDQEYDSASCIDQLMAVTNATALSLLLTLPPSLSVHRPRRSSPHSYQRPETLSPLVGVLGRAPPAPAARPGPATTAGEARPATAREAREEATTAGLDGAGGVHDTTLLSPESSRVERLVGVDIDTEADPGEDALLQGLADESVANNRVIAVSAGAEEEVVDVLDDGHAVGVVGRQLLDGVDEVLVEVDLADLSSTAASDGIVGLLGGAKVDDGCGDR